MKKNVKLLTILLTFFFCIITVNASTTTYERKESENYGVNKKIEITSSNLYNIKNTPLVNAEEKIYDYSDILTNSEEQILFNKIKEYINETNMDMVFVTVSLPYVHEVTNENYAADFYDYNDFGIDFKHYSGVLLLRNTYDPYYNVYLFGEAQRYYNFDRSESVLDTIYYDFKNQNYLSGYTKFINKMTEYYNQGIPSDMQNYELDEDGMLVQKIPIASIIFIACIIGGIATLIIILIMINKNKMIRKSTKAIEYLNKDSIVYVQKKDIFVSEHTTRRRIPSSSSSGGSGGRSIGSSRGSSGRGHSSGGGRRG